ncbi:MAG: precorrin-6y C5,15-methyltransferase (decarboxylating) subunit CbiE [Ruminococcaceae bacterium]|nr:precorrin-6y C5,15-methyltransferase (decarboxylating) subunit CbiE [Oscillospiraceae bacterium]
MRGVDEVRVTFLGVGGGNPDQMSPEALAAIRRAELIVGAQRLLDAVPLRPDQRVLASIRSEEIAEALSRDGAREACVVFSGDTGFYSGARTLLPLLTAQGAECSFVPGLSSVQLLAARLRRPWQDWTLCSAHGTQCDAIAAVLRGRPTFFLTGGAQTPASICAELAETGLGDLRVTVGENLSYEQERVVETTVSVCAGMTFAPLSVLLVEAAALPERTPGGIPDDAFERGDVPMTKQEVRAVVRSKLGVRSGDILWDVGAGTGSVSIELALTAREGRVYAIECGEEACALIERNKRRFGAWNLHLARGTAPEALAGLPAPDAMFVGGSKGALRGIVAAALERNPAVRLCISAIAVETLSAALALCTEMKLEAEVTQLSVSRTAVAGGLHLLKANNPIFLITAKRGGEK